MHSCLHQIKNVAHFKSTLVLLLYQESIQGEGRCMFLCSPVSSPLDRSKRFTLHPLAELFIPTQTWLILVQAYSHTAFSHTAFNTMKRIFTHISTAVYSQLPIYMTEWSKVLWRTQLAKLPKASKKIQGRQNIDSDIMTTREHAN